MDLGVGAEVVWGLGSFALLGLSQLGQCRPGQVGSISAV